MSLHNKVGCDNSDSVERRLEAGGVSCYRRRQVYRDPCPDRILLNGPEDLPATDCHNRSILLRFPDWEESHTALKTVGRKTSLKRKNEGTGQPRESSETRRKSRGTRWQQCLSQLLSILPCGAKMIWEVMGNEKCGSYPGTAKESRQRRTEIGPNHNSMKDNTRTWGFWGSWKKEIYGMDHWFLWPDHDLFDEHRKTPAFPIEKW